MDRAWKMKSSINSVFVVYQANHNSVSLAINKNKSVVRRRRKSS